MKPARKGWFRFRRPEGASSPGPSGRGCAAMDVIHAALVRDARRRGAHAERDRDERAVLECLGGIAEALGLRAELRLTTWRRCAPTRPPGRGGCAARVAGAQRCEARPARRTAAVPRTATWTWWGPGSEDWVHGPWSGEVHRREAARTRRRGHEGRGGRGDARDGGLRRSPLRGRAPGGGIGGGRRPRHVRGAGGETTRFDACLIPEPTGFAVVCAQAGALTFSGEVRGRAAHAAARLEGRSAIDAYVPVHAALARARET